MILRSIPVMSPRISSSGAASARTGQPCGPVQVCTTDELFLNLVRHHQSALRQALVARFGVQVGNDAAASAWSWAWEHRETLASLANPVGYLYRVAQSSTRSQWTWQRRTTATFPLEQRSVDQQLPVDLADVMARLSEPQRICVLLIHSHGWRYSEVAGLLGISVTAVTNHLHRGTKKLRKLLQED